MQWCCTMSYSSMFSMQLYEGLHQKIHNSTMMSLQACFINFKALELQELQLRSSCQTFHHGQHVGIFRCFSMALAAQPEYAIDVLQTAFMIFNLVHADIRVSVSSNIGLQSPNVLYWLCCVHVCICAWAVHLSAWTMSSSSQHRCVRAALWSVPQTCSV